MSTIPKPPRSTLLSSGRGKAGPFGALLAGAAKDPAVARGLALAYGSLDVEARGKIVQAVVADARAEGISASAALASLLAVEDDADVARAIANAISEEGGAGLASTAGPRALVAGDEERGGILLIRPLHGTFVEVMGLAWKRDGGVTHAIFDPLVHDEAASGHTARLPDGLKFEEVPMSYAIDLLAPVLWAHRRANGALPPGAERFADLFSIAQPLD
ncbi:MAG: hypothetical protein IPK60_02010 [Sandaracinaceae bacterium]|nr:hypothetical protein [Sandaracinaceae bacterium]